MISTINNNHSIHYNNSKQNKNNIHKSDDKNKIKEKEEKKSNAEIKKNNSQRRIVKNSDENKENKNTENIKKDYKKKKERKSSMENKDNNESKDIKEIPKELSSNKNNITKYNKDNNTNSEENKPIKNVASSIKNKIDTDEEKVKYFDISKITNVQIPKDYLNIIYYNLLIEEKKGISPMPDHTYMGRQSEINEKMRSILVDWLIDVHFKFGFTDETLFMTVSIIDRYLSVEQITRTNFQLLGITALMIACKHEEIDLPKIDDFIYITDNAYKKNEVIKMEFDVLSKLNFAFLYPSPIKFFEYLSFNFNFEKKQHMMGKYLMESFLLDVKNTKYKPSIISCACAYIVMKFFKMKNYQETYNKKFFVLDETKEKFSEHNIKECAKDICLLVDNINKTNYQACVKKYSKPEQENVAMIIMNN
jgi:cyclin B